MLFPCEIQQCEFCDLSHQSIYNVYSCYRQKISTTTTVYHVLLENDTKYKVSWIDYVTYSSFKTLSRLQYVISLYHDYHIIYRIDLRWFSHKQSHFLSDYKVNRCTETPKMHGYMPPLKPKYTTLCLVKCSAARNTILLHFCQNTQKLYFINFEISSRVFAINHSWQH